jgi:hypothetical protein
MRGVIEISDHAAEGAGRTRRKPPLSHTVGRAIVAKCRHGISIPMSCWPYRLQHLMVWVSPGKQRRLCRTSQRGPIPV